MMYRYRPRAFLVHRTHEVELPNHETAIHNLDFCNPALRVQWWEKEKPDQCPSEPSKKS